LTFRMSIHAGLRFAKREIGEGKIEIESESENGKGSKSPFDETESKM